MKIFVSDKDKKKYKAVFSDGSKIYFGAVNYKQYKDTTPLKHYADNDHNDEKRRLNYYKRHFHTINWTKDNFKNNRKVLLDGMNKKSASYLSARYLW